MSKSTTKSSSSNKNLSTKSKINNKSSDTKSNSLIKTNKTTTAKTDTSKKSLIKNEEKEITKTSTKPKRTSISTTQKIPATTKTTTHSTAAISLQNTKTNTRSQPLRAKHIPEIVNNLKNTQNRPISKTNVMNTIHNVTVLSPPSQRKETNKITKTNKDDSRSRTRTRTLDPEEVIVLKKGASSKSKIGPKSLETYFGGAVDPNLISNATEVEENDNDSKPVMKEAIAYQINFSDKKTKEKSVEKRKIESAVPKSASGKSEEKLETEDYEDDFESYESDFETGTSSSPDASESLALEEDETDDDDDDDNIETGINVPSSNINDNNKDLEEMDSESYNEEDNDDDSEETQQPITVIHRDKDDERKLDSGNYDMNSRKEKLQQIQYQNQHQQQQLDSIDTITGNSEQLDSGISYNANTITIMSSISKSTSATSSSSSKFLASGTFINTLDSDKLSKFSKRGQDLMKKIQLDEINYILFDLKPISYENYMKIYGNINTNQRATQTNENRMNADTQTNELQLRSIWTQHPPQYDLNFMKNRNLRNLQNAYGEFEETEMSVDDNNQKANYPLTSSNDNVQLNNEELVKSLKALQQFRRNELKRIQEIQKPINFDRLNEFLHQNLFTISNILNKKNQAKKFQNPDKNNTNQFSKGYFVLNMNFINALKVVKIFANTQLNLILTVHESIEGIYRSEFLNLISVWTISDSEKPIRLLSTWSEVCRADICSENSDIIICGLRDGSIAMWDLRETYSFCSKLDGYLRHFPATQSIAPVFNINNNEKTTNLIDLGAVVDVKSFRKSERICDLKAYKPIQIVSLNDTGILTIWTLVETSTSNNPLLSSRKFQNNNKRIKNSTKIEYNSPWARIKLIQSEICDLRDYLNLKNIRLKSNFDKTKSYFENDLFNDNVLKELQEIQNDNNNMKLGLNGLRFTNLDTGLERIYIGTNRNFLITCTKTLRYDQFYKIIIDETKFLFSTTFRLLKSEEYLLIGLSNGSVMVIQCNLNKYQNFHNNNSNDNNKNQSDNSQSDDFKQRPSSSSSNNNKFDNFELPYNDEIGKSCTIQNIIRNERKTQTYNKNNDKFDSRKSSFDEINIMEKFHDEDYYHIYDQQIILDGLNLRKNLIQNIEITNNGKKLFVLTDGKLRIYDFMYGKEITSQFQNDDKKSDNNIYGLAMTKDVSSNQNLIVLMKNDEVQVHLFK